MTPVAVAQEGKSFSPMTKGEPPKGKKSQDSEPEFTSKRNTDVKRHLGKGGKTHPGMEM